MSCFQIFFLSPGGCIDDIVSNEFHFLFPVGVMWGCWGGQACMFYCVFVATGERESLFSSLFFSFLLLSLLWLFRIRLDLGAFFCSFRKWSWIVLRLCLLVSVAVGLLNEYSSLKTLNHFFFLTWLIYTALMEYSLLYNLLSGQQDFFDNVISLCFFVVHGLQDFQL